MENYENINNNYQNPYYGEDVRPAQGFGKSQTSLLAKALLIAGIGFVLICGLSVLFMWAFLHLDPSVLIQANILFPVVFGCLLLSMGISMLWMKILWKGKATGLTILVYSLYIISMSVGFGFLFARLWLLQYKIIFLAFGVTGLLFLLLALISKVIGARGMITFGKIVMVTGIISGILFFAFMITMLIVGITGGWGGASLINAYSWLILALTSFAMFFYIIVDIKVISKASEFNEYTGVSEMAPAVVWYFGFKLLSDIVNLLFWVVIWITRLARR